jgi:hypothetical protein
MLSPEGWEKKELDAYLDSIGAYVIKPMTGGFGGSGHGDRICCIDGIFVSIEVKREGKEPTPIQWRRIEEVEAAGGFAFWGTAAKIIGDMKIAFDSE